MLLCQNMAQDTRLRQYSNDVTSMTTNGETTATASMAQPSISAEPPSDNVSSLRALALSTLRSKRRKDTSTPASVLNHPLPARPPPPDVGNVLLDYGTEIKEETDSFAPSTLQEPRKSDIDNTPQAATDAQMKEEGEISDEEYRASSIASSSSPKFRSKDAEQGRRSPRSTKAFKSSSSMTVKHEPNRTPPLSNGRYSRPPSMAPQDRDIWNNWVPSADHVRPGLKMNMDQFNLVKELILDLLGWGVSPEYLVDCGLTREAVFYTFMELNLRLPQNLDVSGLLPSPPPPAQASKDDAQALPKDIPKSSLNHPLPTKPRAETSPVPASSFSNQTPSDGQNLSDMEARRKLELQARKAVLAARRKKTAPGSMEPSTSTSTSSATPAVLNGSIVNEPEPIAPVTAIDDFLKTVIETSSTPSQPSTPNPVRRGRALSGGVPLGVSSGSSASSTVPTNSPVVSAFPSASMDIDVKGGAPSLSRPEPSIGGVVATAELADVAITESGVQTPSLSAPQTCGQTSGSTTPPAGSSRDQRSKDAFSSTSAGAHFTNGRRGTKRPVAMDFVDVGHDAGSQHSASSSAQPPYVRRKLTGFAGLGSHAPRKCVIDLSDSEEDDEHDEGTSGKPVSLTERLFQSALGTFYGTMTPPPAPRPPSTRPISSTGMKTPKPASRALSPEALEEKERQIRQMRELIARREQERLRKLAEKSRTPAATPPPLLTRDPDQEGPPPSPLASVSLKETNNSLPFSSAAELARQPSQSESSSTNDQADEDVVMQSLEPSGLASASESTLATPTDIKMIAMEHATTGEPVLTEEAKGETGINPTTLEETDVGAPVDVTAPDTSSAQVESKQDSSQFFTNYVSPFSYYPLLRSSGRVVPDFGSDVSDSATTSPVSSSCTSTFVALKVPIPDLRPLRVATALQGFGDGEGRRICQFELPGGGVCADKSCTDLHLSDLEPDDHAIARYLRENIPDVLQPFDESEIVDQLLQVRQKSDGIGKSSSQAASSSTPLENRVIEAISALLQSGR